MLLLFPFRENFMFLLRQPEDQLGLQLLVFRHRFPQLIRQLFQ
jgi:hypothetical protein